MRKKFELAFTREFLRKLKQLDRQDQIRILRELRLLEDKPLTGEQLTGRLGGLFSFRVGDYRVIYQILGKKIVIRTVGHRRAVYR